MVSPSDKKKCTRCEDVLPLADFGPRKNRPRRDCYCRRCRSQMTVQRKQNKTEPKPYFTEWHERWVSVEPKALLKLAGAARRYANKKGHAWFADELAAHAIIERAQGNKVYLGTLLIELLRHYYGRPESARNNTKGFEDWGLNENENC